MKKCPKCKAEIGEEARFCLYCMTSFEEKQLIEAPKENNRRWLIIAAVLVLALAFLSIFLFMPKDIFQDSSISNSSDISAHNSTILSQQQSSASQSNTPSAPSGNSQAQSTSSNTIGNTPTSSAIQSSSSENTTSITSASSSPGSDKTENDSLSTSTTQSEETAVTYIYRDAQYGDDFSVSTNLENAVVITGVKTASLNGRYEIPEKLDGKKVIAVMALAFCDDSISNTVKTVVVPSSVKTIWNNAFASCYNLTDIYFKGSSIYTEAKAFPEASKRNGTLTIHCSVNCSDRNFRYYKNSASSYDAEYKEWNG